MKWQVCYFSRKERTIVLSFKFFTAELKCVIAECFSITIKIITMGRNFRDHLVAPTISCPEKVNGTQSHIQGHRQDLNETS